MISISLHNMKLSSNLITCCAKNYGLSQLKHSKRVIRLDLRTFASNNVTEKLKPFVQHPYSYAYGRSDKHLEYVRIADLLSKQAKLRTNSLAIVSQYENISKTFGQLDDDVNKLAKGMHELGLKRGDVFGLWSCNSYSWVQAQYACARLGLILCTVNPVYRAPELNYALKKGQIKALLMPGVGSQQEVVNKYQEVFREGLQFKDETVTDELILKDVILMDGSIPSERTEHDLKFHTIDSLVSNDGKLEQTLLDQVCPDDPAMIMFTSGTTGKPKGAYLSHFTLANNCLLTGEAFTNPDDNTSMCIPLPFFHAFAGVLGNISMTAAPFKSVIPNLKYDVKLIVDSIIKNNCTHIIVTPTQVIDILNYVEKNGLKITTLKSCLIGGAPVPVEVAHRINRIIPSCNDVRIGYGATETGPCTTASYENDTFEQKLETVGSPLDFVEVKIVNPVTGVITKIGEQGELLSRGHTVMIGYWRDEAKTREAVNDSRWYKTGDLAVMDEEGFVKIVGRTKEMLIKGGENVYPREVEEILHRHPDIFDAYVVGVPDERYGEEVCAWVQLKSKETKVTEEDIKEFCKQNISYFKVPRYVLFVDGFPMTPTGKAQKFIMRDKTCEILGLKENKPSL